MKLLWDEQGWNDYIEWQDNDRKTLKKINALLKDIQRNPYDGIGKPEPLKEDLSGWWSRRIDSANRIVYREKDGVIVIASCKGHYDN
ncbi:MAG: Txe/YoeB family addiction module toxin [Synergistaceae bacterium]|nr:Txe/YoeB family addiction module toxin [Synergistaceae bacterium]MBR0258390.1 Txe/YoeB family addiction module toxin [Synergistaceae bacterium]